MENGEFNNFVNTNNELALFMEPAVALNNVEETQGLVPLDHHQADYSVDPLDTITNNNEEQPWPQDFTVYSSEATQMQEQPAQPVADEQPFANDMENATFLMDTLTNGDPFLGSYRGILGLGEIDPNYNFQTWSGDAEPLATQEPVTEQAQTLPLAVTESRTNENNIESSTSISNHLPNVHPSENIDPNIEFINTALDAGLPTDRNTNLGTYGEESVAELPTFITSSAPDISAMVNSYITYNNNNFDTQGRVNVTNQGDRNQPSKILSQGDNSPGLNQMAANQSDYAKRGDQLHAESPWKSSGSTLPSPMLRTPVQEQDNNNTQNLDDFSRTTVHPPSHMNQQYHMRNPRNEESGYQTTGSYLHTKKRHYLATETANSLEQLSSQYGMSNSRKRSRVQDEDATISQKRPRYSPAQARVQGGIQYRSESQHSVGDRFEPLSGNQGSQNFASKCQEDLSGSWTYDNYQNPRNSESRIGNNSMFAGVGNSYAQSGSSTGMRSQHYMDAPRNGPSHMPPPPNNLEGHMDPHLFDRQMANRTENVDTNQALPPLPEFQLSMLQDFTGNGRAPPPGGYYSTTLMNRQRNPTVHNSSIEHGSPAPANTQQSLERAIPGGIIPGPANAKPLEREILGGIIPATRRVRKKPVNCSSGEEPAKKSKRRPWDHRLESQFPRVHMLEEEVEVVEKNYKDNPRKAFQDMSGMKNDMKAIHIDWEQVELLNSIRQNAREEEKERKRLCKPEEYIAKRIPGDYKPKARLLECYNAWLKAKQEHGMVSNSWTDRKRRTADKKLYKPSKEGKTQRDGSLQPILTTSPESESRSLLASDGETSRLEGHGQSSTLAQPRSPEVRKRKRAEPQGELETSDEEEPSTKKSGRK